MRFNEHYFTEASNLSSELNRKWSPNKGTGIVKPGLRGDVFLKKVIENSPFELLDGEEINVVLSKEDLKELQNMQKTQNYKDFEKKITIKDTNGVVYSLKQFAKTPEFGGQAGKTVTKGSPENYEKAITNSWNRLKGYEANIPMEFAYIAEAGDKIVESLNNQLKGEKGEAVYTGSMRAKDVSEYWKQHAVRPDKTPKTDILIGKYNISLKMGKATQLCSAVIIEGEGQALVYNAIDKSDDISPKLQKEVEKWFKVDKSGKSLLGTAPEVKVYGRETFEVNHKAASDTFRKLIKESTGFSQNFVFEAMSGERKFEKVSDANMAVAKYILAASMDGNQIMLHPVNDTNYVNKIAKQVDVRINWKSSGGSASANIRAAVKTGSIDSTEESVVYSIKSLMEYAESIGIDTKVLNEGISDVFKKIWNTIVAIIKKGVSYVMKFLGIEVESVDIEGNESVNFF